MSSSRPCAFHHSRANRIIVWLLAFCLSVMPLLACADPMPLIPIQTGAESMGCSASGTGSGSSASPAPHIDSGGSNLICTVHGKKEAPKSLATRILEFAEGFAKGFVNGLWDQITGFWGLIMHAGSILKFGETLAEHPTRTWHLLEATLGKKGAQVLHDLNPQKIKQQLICEPYSSGKMAGNTVETVASFLVPGVGEAGDGVKVADELDHVVELVDDSEKVAAEDGGKAASNINPCKLAGAGSMEEVSCALGEGNGAVKLENAEATGRALADGKKVYWGKTLNDLSNKEIGDIGEGYIAGHLKQNGYTEFIYLKNGSGHGIDVLARKPGTNKIVVYEVKSTRLADKTSIDLSHYQSKGGESYLDRQVENKRIPEAARDKAKEWLEKAEKANEPVVYRKTLVRISKNDKNLLQAHVVKDEPWPPKTP
ncbi:MAG: hypothetical protein PHX24_06340 [Acidithiobacillus sp.]|nr:hypothetical protein [Acidithiobacillus sp.]